MARGLIVENDLELRALSETLLTRHGFEPLTASGLQTLARQPELLKSDVILLDFDLGEFSGLDVMEYLDDLRINAAIILISASDQPGAEALLDAGREHGLRMLGFLPRAQMERDLGELLAKLGGSDSAPTVEALDSAMAGGHFCLAYQPQFDLRSNRTLGVEVLLRWRDPQRGMLYPDSFLPLAEQSGRIVRLSWYVLALALAQRQRWQARGWQIEMSINIPAQLLRSERLLADFDALIERHWGTVSGITLELTESAGIACLGYARHLLAGLRRRGFRLSLDDFGTGYASMTQLYRLPFDELKLDRSFVSRCDQDQRAHTIVKTMLELGRGLGLRVVAEGIETPAQQQMLEKDGCVYGQGYGFSRPMLEADFNDWYDRQLIGAA
ncbi:EAL domain-containing response regulator [Kushneria aurantia]|uniref:EAL domain-containing response regulator n=1 Tax=Kushneria aurantia TaxID=504092 RepID=A0ABV6G4L0_9GAMM|nr:EAL domain-containing response regulator [Kushneria aurantia]